MERPRLFCRRNDRLFTRFKMMLYAWRLMEQVDGEVVMLWPGPGRGYPEEAAGYRPGMIFDLSAFAAAGGERWLTFVETEERPPEDAVALDGPEWAAAARRGLPRALFADGSRFRQEQPHRHRLEGEPGDRLAMLARVRQLFLRLPVHADVEAARAAFRREHGLEAGGYVGLHVRRGDIYGMLPVALRVRKHGGLVLERLDRVLGYFVARTAPLEFYRPAVEAAIGRGRRILFTSDTPEVIAEFRHAFGDAFVDLAGLTMPVAIQKAFADFLVLADAAEVIGTSSNFSSFAAEMGDVPFVNVAGSGDVGVMADALRAAARTGRADEAAVAEAVRRLGPIYEAFARRRAASELARAVAAARASRVGAVPSSP